MYTNVAFFCFTRHFNIARKQKKLTQTELNPEDALAKKIKQLSPINKDYVIAVIEAFEAKEKLQGKR